MAASFSNLKIVHIGGFVGEWSAILNDVDLDDANDVEHAHSIHSSDDIAQELETVCSESTLNCPDEPAEVTTLLKNVPRDLELATTRAQVEELERRKDPIHWGHLRQNMKYHLQKGPWIHLSMKATAPATPIARPETTVNVRIYRPFFRMRTLAYPLLSQEFQVLGSQSLTQLRDCIECPSDDCVAGDFSQSPDLPMDVKAKDLYKSGAFVIENVFYNDTRHSDCRDYSRKITEWAKDKSRRVGPYMSGTMETTTFNDLRVRLGQPYLYLHQGDCEHLIVFSDVRLLHCDDCLDLTCYPLMVGERRDRQAHCRVCQTCTAKWVTHESPLTPEDPCFFCNTCYRTLHYGADGHSLATFTAHPYTYTRDKLTL